MNGKPKMVSERYLGTAADIEALLDAHEDAMVPERTRHLDFGAVAAVWGLLTDLDVAQVIDQACGPGPAGLRPGAAGVAAVVDGPLELDAVQPRRPMLETDHGHVDLGIIAVAQSRRRVVRLRWSGHLGWSTHDPKLLLTPTGIGNPSADEICGPDEVLVPGSALSSDKVGTHGAQSFVGRQDFALVIGEVTDQNMAESEVAQVGEGSADLSDSPDDQRLRRQSPIAEG